jgi:hypothetical protein
MRYGRADHLPKGADRAEGRAGDVLVVRVWAIEEPAVLRRVARRHGVESEEGGDYGGENGGVVRVQAFGLNAILRWDTFEIVSDAD